MSDATAVPLSPARLVSFRFHGELAAFLAPARRDRSFEVRCAAGSSLKHVIEALGVPHTEVGRVLVDGRPAPLERRLCPGERVSVHPHAARCGKPCPSPPPRLIADAHLGGLAVMVTRSDGRPIALRRRFSPGLPLSDVCNDYSIPMLTYVLAE